MLHKIWNSWTLVNFLSLEWIPSTINFTFTDLLSFFFLCCLYFCFWYWQSLDGLASLWPIYHFSLVIDDWKTVLLTSQLMISVMMIWVMISVSSLSQRWGSILCQTRDDEGPGFQPFLFVYTILCLIKKKTALWDLDWYDFSVCVHLNHGQICKSECKALYALCAYNRQEAFISHYTYWKYFLYWNVLIN